MPSRLLMYVSPTGSEVALVDGAWQDYPRLRPGDEWVGHYGDSLTHPDDPPFPGFAVRTASPRALVGPPYVQVEVWDGDPPPGMHKVHDNTLYVSVAGVWIGNAEDRIAELDIPSGHYPVEVWVDAERPDAVQHVVFLLGDAVA